MIVFHFFVFLNIIPYTVISALALDNKYYNWSSIRLFGFCLLFMVSSSAQSYINIDIL